MINFKSVPSRLARITSSGKYIREIDGLRFVAIMPVLIQHLSERLYRYSSVEWATPIAEDPVAFLASRGTIGVFLFFSISGFILCLPFAKYHLQGGRKLSYRSYLWRRVTRLEPPYLIWMTFFFIILLIRQPMQEGLWSHWGYSMIYMHNWVYSSYTPINPVAWSLEIEIQFYLLAPFLAALFFSIKNTVYRRSILVVAIFVFIAMQHNLGWMALPYKISLLGQLQHFLIGFLMADIYLVNYQDQQPKQYWLFDGIAVVAFFTLCFTWSEEWGKNLLFSAALFLLFLAAFRGKGFSQFLRKPWIAAIGGMCYTIYLIHLPLMEGLIRFTRHIHLTNWFSLNLIVQGLIVVPIILAIAAFFYLLLEKPFMDKHWPTKLKNWIATKWLSTTQLKKTES